MLIRITHPINPRPGIPKELIPILLRPPRIRHISPLHHRRPAPNLIRPLLQRGELGQINLQRARRTTHPRVIRYIGNGILRAGEVSAFLQSGLEDGVETLCLVDVPLDTVVGACAGEEAEVVCLALNFMVNWVSGYGRGCLGGGNIPCIGPTPPIWNISQDSCSMYSGVPGA